jgi:hypothetical protein
MAVKMSVSMSLGRISTDGGPLVSKIAQSHEPITSSEHSLCRCVWFASTISRASGSAWGRRNDVTLSRDISPLNCVKVISARAPFGARRTSLAREGLICRRCVHTARQARAATTQAEYQIARVHGRVVVVQTHIGVLASPTTAPLACGNGSRWCRPQPAPPTRTHARTDALTHESSRQGHGVQHATPSCPRGCLHPPLSRLLRRTVATTPSASWRAGRVSYAVGAASHSAWRQQQQWHHQYQQQCR